MVQTRNCTSWMDTSSVLCSNSFQVFASILDLETACMVLAKSTSFLREIITISVEMVLSWSLSIKGRDVCKHARKYNFNYNGDFQGDCSLKRHKFYVLCTRNRPHFRCFSLVLSLETYFLAMICSSVRVLGRAAFVWWNKDSHLKPTVAIWVQLYSILCQTGLSRHL